MDLFVDDNKCQLYDHDWKISNKKQRCPTILTEMDAEEMNVNIERQQQQLKHRILTRFNKQFIRGKRKSANILMALYSTLKLPFFSLSLFINSGKFNPFFVLFRK